MFAHVVLTQRFHGTRCICGTFGSQSGHAAAKARMYCRLLRESPVMSGNSRRRSSASLVMTALPPSLAFLLCQDPVPDVPVQVDEGGVYDPLGLHACRADVVLQVGEELGVAVGNEGTGCGHGDHVYRRFKPHGRPGQRCFYIVDSQGKQANWAICAIIGGWLFSRRTVRVANTRISLQPSRKMRGGPFIRTFLRCSKNSYRRGLRKLGACEFLETPVPRPHGVRQRS